MILDNSFLSYNGREYEMLRLPVHTVCLCPLNMSRKGENGIFFLVHCSCFRSDV